MDPAQHRWATKEDMMADTRTETDSFGPIEVPGDAYWGAQTERSIGNFPFGPAEQMPVGIVRALGFIKQGAARVNARFRLLERPLPLRPGRADARRHRPRTGLHQAGGGTSERPLRPARAANRRSDPAGG